MPQPTNSINDRKKLLRKLSYLLGIYLILFWASVYCWPDEHSGSASHWIIESSLGLPLSIGFSLLVIALCCFLYYGNEDGWWGVIYLFFLLPSVIMLVSIFPNSLGMLLVIFFLPALYQSRPATTILLDSIPDEIDELGTALHIEWSEQPLWKLVAEAKQGKVDEAVKALRNNYHMTWDEADKAIHRWMDDELGLKLYLLKLHAQSLPNAG